jgi:hypothetical protein
MASGIMALIGKAKPGDKSGSPMPMDDEEAPEGSAGELAAEDFANAKDAAERYAAFKRMFKACEMEGHSEVEDDEEAGY